MTALKNLTPAKAQAFAAVFAALGDETRLSIVARLADGRPQSISTLTANTELTRQAVSRHLSVLEDVGLVQSKRSGRETLFEIDLPPFKDMNDYMNFVSSKWDQALGRLKSFVEQ